MRRIQTGFLLAAFIFTAAAASAQTADEIIEKTVTAMGGRAALSKITSRVTKGTMTVGTENGDIPATVEITQQAPNKSRRYIVLDLSQFGMGTSTVDQRFDGTSGYLLDAMRGNSALTGSQLENLKNNIFPSPFL